MLEQLLPFVRFDGYFVLSDLVRRARPVRPRRPHPPQLPCPGAARDPRVAGLRRRARIVVTGWVLCVIPLLLAHPGVPPAAPPRDQPGAVAVRRARQAHLMSDRGRRAPVRDGRGRRARRRPCWPCRSPGSLYIVIGLARRLGHPGPALVRRAGRPPPPGRRGRPGLPDRAGRPLEPAGPVPRLVAAEAATLTPPRRRRDQSAGTGPREVQARRLCRDSLPVRAGGRTSASLAGPGPGTTRAG